ncbi:MAG TPA: fatty acid CoA ligase family protein [Opitutaceae bacterium]
MPTAAENANIAQHLPAMAARQPGTAALLVPRGRRDGRIDYLTLSFADLAAEAAAWQAEFTARGVRRGDRTLVMVRPGLPLIAAVFALFGLGAVPVVIDPGMGLKSFLACVRRSRPRALVGIPLARVISHLFRNAFGSVEVRVAASGSPVARQPRTATGPFTVVTSDADELAAVLFTSGSTGAPKGVRYTHGMFAAQVELIRTTYGITPGERDLPMLPVFALFNPALGMTTVVPELDPARPATVDPAKIVQAIQQEAITTSFGSPTLWAKIARHAEANQITLPTMKRVLCAGAPVPPGLWSAMRAILPNGELQSPYGATEVLPVSSIRASDVLAETAAATLAGRGTCVGPIIAGNEAKIIALTDAPIATLANARELSRGEIGEIIVRGPTVTTEYDELPVATAAAKVRDAAGAVWHRMGDAGYLDAQGRLWFCGRKAERVTTAAGPLFTEQVEPAFTSHPAVRRAALVSIGAAGHQQPALVIEPVDPAIANDRTAATRLVAELTRHVQGHAYAAAVTRFFVHPSLPVDVRHNAKIHRLTLARWAETAAAIDVPPASS